MEPGGLIEEAKSFQRFGGHFAGVHVQTSPSSSLLIFSVAAGADTMCL